MYPEVLYRSTNDHHPDLVFFYEEGRVYKLQFLYDYIAQKFLKPPYHIRYYKPGLKWRYNQIYRPEIGPEKPDVISMTREDFFGTWFDELL